MKSFGILEFDKEKSGYKFGKHELLLLVIGLVVFFAAILLPIPGLELAGRKALAIILLCLFCYANPGIPNLFASFLMFVLAIAMGLIGYGQYAMAVGTSPLIMLTCLFIVSAGITNTNLAQRLAYTLLLKLGHKPKGIVAAMVLAGVIVSALIANMPACLILAAIGASVLKELGEKPGESRLGKAVLIGISTATIVGGVAFISSSGTNPSNVALIEAATDSVYTISYNQWAAIGLPFAIIMTPVLIFVLNRVFGINEKNVPLAVDKDSVQKKLHDLGPVTKSEIRYLITLAIMMVLFLTTSVTHLNVPVVTVIGMLLVICPGWGTVNIDQAVKTVPWSVVFFAAVTVGFANVVSSSGLGEWISNVFLGWTEGLPPLVVILVISVACVIINGITMCSPGTLIIPSVAMMAVNAGFLPMFYAFPVCIMTCASFVTPLLPDSQLTYGHGYWKYSDMLKFGWVFAIFWIVIFCLLLYFVGPIVGLA